MKMFRTGDLAKVSFGWAAKQNRGYRLQQQLGRITDIGPGGYRIKFFNGDENCFARERVLEPFNTPIVDVHGNLHREFYDANAPLAEVKDSCSHFARVTSYGRLAVYRRDYNGDTEWTHWAKAAGYDGLFFLVARNQEQPRNRWSPKYSVTEYLTT